MRSRPSARSPSLRSPPGPRGAKPAWPAPAAPIGTIRDPARVARTLSVARLGARFGGAYAVHRARRVFAAAFELRTAAQVAETLGHMKGALMKLGQMASYIVRSPIDSAGRGGGRVAGASSTPALTTSLPAAQAWVWEKHGLASLRHAGPALASDASGAIYSTAPTTALSLAARVDGFRLADLDAAMYSERRLVAVACLRGSAFAVPVHRLGAACTVSRDRRVKAQRSMIAAGGVDQAGCQRLEDELLAVVQEHPGRTAAELAELVSLRHRAERRVLARVLTLLCIEGRLVSGRVRGSWRSNVREYELPERWVPGVTWTCDRDEALRQVAHWFLRAYGPATAADLGWWSGIGRRAATHAIALLGANAVPVSIEGVGGDLVVLADEIEGLAAAGGVERGVVRLLPVWDVFGLRGRDRRRLVDTAREPFVYDQSGNLTSVVAADGLAAGVWELEGDDDAPTFAVALFDPVGPRSRRWRAIEEEAGRVAVAIGLGPPTVRASTRPPRALTVGQNSFMKPIRFAESA